jgi:hypothetical protein
MVGATLWLSKHNSTSASVHFLVFIKNIENIASTGMVGSA